MKQYFFQKEMKFFLRNIRFRWQLWRKKPYTLVFSLALLPVLAYLGTLWMTETEQQRGIPVVLVDEDHSPYSVWLIAQLQKQELLQVDIAASQEEAYNRVMAQEAEVAFIFPQGFSQRLLAGEEKGAIIQLYNPLALSVGFSKELLASGTMRIISNIQAANLSLQLLTEKRGQLDQPGEVWKSAWEYSDSFWQPQPLLQVEVKQLSLGQGKQQRSKTSNLLILGWLSALTMLLMYTGQSWLVEEKEQGILSRIQTLGGHLPIYILAHSLPTLLCLAISLILAWFLLAKQLSVGSLLLLLGYLVCCWLVSLAVAMGSRENRQYLGWAIAITLLTSFFGGAFFPLGEWLSRYELIAQFTPQGWLLEGIKQELLGGGN